MALVDDIADYLSSGDIGVIGSTLFKTFLPDAPDACVAVLATGGMAPAHAMGAGPGGAQAERPNIQVLARDARPDAADFMARKAFFLLDKLGSRTINGVSYLGVFALQSPFPLPRDATARSIVACNYQILRAPATSS